MRTDIAGNLKSWELGMGKYILKRLGYMLVVMLILSLLMYLVYAMIPFDRGRAEA